MKRPYLEVTFRRGRPLAAYLYLPRHPSEKSSRSERIEPGLVVDFNSSGKAIGIEITAPSRVSLGDLNRILENLGMSLLTQDDLSPLLAA